MAGRVRGHGRRRNDPRYRKLWVGDNRRVLRDCLFAYDGPIQMGAVTRPGSDVLPWDGQHVYPDIAKASNLAFQSDWSQLHEAAARRTRRKFGDSFHYLGRVFEPQKRGVYHCHPLVGVKTPRARAAARHYWQQLAELAGQYRFGFVERRPKTRDAAHAAHYAAKYLSDAGGSKLGIADVVMRDDCPPRPVWVSPKLQRRCGSSMRACRERRIVWNLASHLAALDPDGCSIPEAKQVRARLAFNRRMRGDPHHFGTDRDDPARRGRPHYIARHRGDDTDYNEQLAMSQRHPVNIAAMYEEMSHLDRLTWAAEKLLAASYESE